MAEAPLCPSTGQPMVRGTRPLEIRYRGRSRTVEMPGWYCDGSGESIHSREDMKVSDQALINLKAASRNLAGPDEVRDIRARLDLTREEADRLIADEAGIFEKHEDGRVLTSRPMTLLLRLLNRYPDELERLRIELAAADPETGVQRSNETASSFEPTTGDRHGATKRQRRVSAGPTPSKRTA